MPLETPENPQNQQTTSFITRVASSPGLRASVIRRRFNPTAERPCEPVPTFPWPTLQLEISCVTVYSDTRRISVQYRTVRRDLIRALALAYRARRNTRH